MFTANIEMVIGLTVAIIGAIVGIGTLWNRVNDRRSKQWFETMKWAWEIAHDSTGDTRRTALIILYRTACSPCIKQDRHTANAVKKYTEQLILNEGREGTK